MLLQIYVIKFFIIFLNNIVLAIAGNKEDMYANEEVEEEEAKKLAEDLKAIFQKTSAKSANGVEDLFIKIGKKFLNPKEFDSSGQAGNSGKILRFRSGCAGGSSAAFHPSGGLLLLRITTQDKARGRFCQSSMQELTRTGHSDRNLAGYDKSNAQKIKYYRSNMS